MYPAHLHNQYQSPLQWRRGLRVIPLKPDGAEWGEVEYPIVAS